MARLELDHIAVSARTLDEGIDFVADRLGVRTPLGGRHPRMNTHNAVMSLGPGVYLEIIAIDPEAGPPEMPRWFALDDPAMRRLLEAGPTLATWIARSDDLAATIAASPVSLGTAHRMARGDLRWQIGIRPDGSMPMAGLFPICIEWPPGPHVSTRMADLGVRLAGITVRPPQPDAFRAKLVAIGAESLVTVEAPKRGQPPLEAELIRPDGRRVSLGGGELAAGPADCA